MRWRSLFEDLESQLETELGADQVDLLAEEERLRLSRLTVRDRIRGLHDAAPDGMLTVTLRDGDRLRLVVAALGRDWIAGEREAGVQRSVVVPLAAVTALDLEPARLSESLRADPAPEPPTELSARLGIGFVLRDLARRRSPVGLRVGGESRHGTIDRVGRDHLDLAEHGPGEPRRDSGIRRVSLIALSALDLVVF